jgi:hypothetical protein
MTLPSARIMIVAFCLKDEAVIRTNDCGRRAHYLVRDVRQHDSCAAEAREPDQ